MNGPIINPYPYYYESEEIKALVESGEAALAGMIDGAYEVYQVRGRIYREVSIRKTPHYRFYLTEEWYGKELIEEVEERKREKENRVDQ